MVTGYREEHLELVSKIPGYRRSLRYKLSPVQTPLTKGDGPEEVQPYLAIHEVDDVATFGSKEAEEASSTPWTEKHVKESHPFIARVRICQEPDSRSADCSNLFSLGS